ncbi:hypothetical protein GOODEAATRI_032900, partial [Goodea atripinnis]
PPHGGSVVSVIVEKLIYRKALNPDVISMSSSETIIYRVSPSILSSTMLATPSWPQGMKPLSTVSWIVDLPSRYKAHLQFINVTQPTCADRHTCIKVKLLGQKEELMSRREDEEVENLWVQQSFYLNMSNCMPEKNHFGARTMIVLQKKNGKESLWS